MHAGRLERLCEFWNSPGWSDQRTVVFLATELHGRAARGRAAPRRRRSRSCGPARRRRGAGDRDRARATRRPRSRCSRSPRGVAVSAVRPRRRPLALPRWPRSTSRGSPSSAGAPPRRSPRTDATSRGSSRSSTRRRRGLEAATTDRRRGVPRGASQRAAPRPATVARLASTLRGLYGFLVDEGVHRRRPHRTARGAARRDEARRSCSPSPRSPRCSPRPARDTPVDVRDRAVLELLYGTAMRVSELVGLDLGDVDFDEELVRVTGKGDKQRLVPLGRDAADALHRWLAAARPRGARSRATETTRRPRRLLQPARPAAHATGRRPASSGGTRDACGLPAATSAHTLRHTCATHMLAHGADVRVIQELLGPRLGRHDPALHEGQRPRTSSAAYRCLASDGRATRRSGT